jgi:hypothetical protein
MHAWLAKGTPPPVMPLIETVQGEDGNATVKRDAHGNAVGGIRLPDIAVPTAAHSGTGKLVEGGSRFAFLYGSAHDFTDSALATLYSSQNEYLAKYDAALAHAIDSGAVLAEDGPRLREAAATWSNRLP